ncbi:MAG TPA: metal-dependent hydrolase [Candidatus Binatia bacterium]|nr:metal-dependent hydrolase [Candidatus Binatia bacterium]
MSITVKWYGHGTYGLDVGPHKIIIDPFFAPSNPAAPVSVDEVEADFILVTHGHGDHVTDALALAKRTGALVISNFEICNWLGRQGHENTHGMNIGGGYQFDFGRAEMTLALHSSGLPDGTYGGNPAGFLILAENRKVYFSGDTALFSDMKLIGDEGLDLAVLHIGDNFTMSPDASLKAIEFLRPKVVIPGHYDTWPIVEQDVSAWEKRVREATDAEPVVLSVGESYTVS